MSATTSRRRQGAHVRRVLTTTEHEFGLRQARVIRCSSCGRVEPESDILKDTCDRCAQETVRKARLAMND
jgi:rRNA maturation endonuclease Nob1